MAQDRDVKFSEVQDGVFSYGVPGLCEWRIIFLPKEGKLWQVRCTIYNDGEKIDVRQRHFGSFSEAVKSVEEFMKAYWIILDEQGLAQDVGRELS